MAGAMSAAQAASDITSSLIGAGASIFGGYMSKRSAKWVMQKQIELAREQMNFQERMSNTAHQREVADLKAAGLNPVLSANGGASTPQGAMANIAGMNPTEDGINSALAIMQQRLNAKATASQIGVNDTQQDLNKQSANAQQYMADMYHESAAYTNEQNRQLQEFGSLERQANLENVYAATAQTLNSIENANKLTNAQVENLRFNNALAASQTSNNKVNTQILSSNAIEAYKNAEWLSQHPVLYNIHRAGSALLPGIFGASALAGTGAAAGHQLKSINKKPVGFRIK